MADILIRGISIPRNCFECPLFTNCDACEGHECGCGLLGGIGYEEDISEDRRRDDCPLVKLPPHGDLIDIRNAENAMFALGNYHLSDYKQGWNDGIKAVIENAPVVIPSNKEETE